MNRNFPPLYAILSADLLSASSAEFAAVFAVKLANAGVGIIQYRNKHAAAHTLLEISTKISVALAGTSARFIVNDRADIARLSGANGVHLGQDDLPVEDARAISQKIIPPSGRADAAAKFGVGAREDFWVGVSAHTPEQVRLAAATPADYIAIGPIFATTTKKNHEAIVGTDFIRAVRKLTTKPLVAIGGITTATADEVFRAGADCIAVARDLIRADNPAACAAEYLAIARNVRK
jgi:thiamine-phosphate pyrophosphorylase